jgi:hypothetical protein
MTRTLPASLSTIVEQLELDQPLVVTVSDLARFAETGGIASSPKLIAERLRERGWLLPTATPGVFEFAPGAHAGPIGHGNPFLELIAALAKRPDLGLAVCLSSASWAHGFLDRSPDRLEVASPSRTGIPAGLATRSRVVVFDAQLPPISLRGAPVHRPATIAVHLAARPGEVRSWRAVAESLPRLLEATDLDDLDREIAGRPRAVRVRLAYLLQGVAPELTERLFPAGEARDSKVWFGPRGKLRRHSQRFGVADTLLPFDPASLGSSAS